MEASDTSTFVAQIEQRFKDLEIPKNQLAKKLGQSESSVSHVFSGRTPMSRRFEAAALDLIEQSMKEEEAHASRRDQLLNPEDYREAA